MKKIITKLLTATFVLNCFYGGFAGLTSVSAASYDAAESAVTKAEGSGLQTDIDNAQAAIIRIAPSDERKALEERIDAVQQKAEYVLCEEYSQKNVGAALFVGGGWNFTVQEDPVNPGSLVSKQVYNSEQAGGMYQYPSISPAITGKLVIEQSVMFDGAQGNDRYYSLYYSVGEDVNYNNLFTIWPEGCTGLRVSYGNGDWNEVSLRSPVRSGTWYDIAITMDTVNNRYDITVTNEGNIVGQTQNVALLDRFDHTKGLDDFKCRFSGIKSDDHDDAVYVSGLKVRGVGLNDARAAVVKAERSNLAEDVEAADDALANVGDGTDKDALSLRLNNVKNIIESEKLVSKAEKTRAEADYDKATALVLKLDAGYRKDGYLDRLGKIVVLTPVVAATEALERAEDSLSDNDAAEAKTLIDSLSASDKKSELLTRYNKLMYVIAAEKAVSAAEKSMSVDDYKKAESAIALISDNETKNEYIARHSAIIGASVNKAEASRVKKDLDNAKALAELESDTSKKEAYNKRLDAIAIRSGIADATEAVEAAEASKNEADIETADALVNELENSDAKAALQSRLKNIYEIVEAIKLLDAAEASMEMADAEAALIAVNALIEGDDKKALYRRANEIIAKIEAVAESAREAVKKADQTLASEDINAAKSAVEELKPGTEKDDLRIEIVRVEARKNAIAAVEKMESSGSQADINKAQQAVIQLPFGEEKQALTDRILSAQVGQNSLYNIDYEDRLIGSAAGNYDMIVSVDPDDENNKVAHIHYTDEALAGFGETYPAADPMTGNVTFECDLRFDGNDSNDRYASFYGRRKADAYGIMLFQLNPTENSGGLYMEYYDDYETNNKTGQKVQTTATFSNGKWYTIKMVMHTETETFDMYLIDKASGEQIGKAEDLFLRDADYTDYTRGFTEVYYRFSGKSDAKDCELYMDNIKLYVSGSAQELVIQAESSADRDDIAKARASVENMGDSAEKTALEKRLAGAEAVADANDAMDKLKKTQLIDDMTDAIDKINALPTGYMKSMLLNKASHTICFTPIKLENSEGETEELTGGMLTVSVTALSNDENERSAQLIAALYNEDEEYPKMIASSVSDKKQLKTGADEKLSAVINAGDLSDGNYMLSVYIWDDVDGMLPIASQTIIR